MPETDARDVGERAQLVIGCWRCCSRQATRSSERGEARAAAMDGGARRLPAVKSGRTGVRARCGHPKTCVHGRAHRDDRADGQRGEDTRSPAFRRGRLAGVCPHRRPPSRWARLARAADRSRNGSAHQRRDNAIRLIVIGTADRRRDQRLGGHTPARQPRREPPTSVATSHKADSLVDALQRTVDRMMAPQPIAAAQREHREDTRRQ